MCEYKFMPDGEHEVKCFVYTDRVVYKNVTVEVLIAENGEISIGWYRQDNTEEIKEI